MYEESLMKELHIRDCNKGEKEQNIIHGTWREKKYILLCLLPDGSYTRSGWVVPDTNRVLIVCEEEWHYSYIPLDI
jgi:hypothetical protein